jgi:hypothetical protein
MIFLITGVTMVLAFGSSDCRTIALCIGAGHLMMAVTAFIPQQRQMLFRVVEALALCSVIAGMLLLGVALVSGAVWRFT